jgi:hypothetical protein
MSVSAVSEGKLGDARGRFLAALGLFVVWVVALAILGVVAGRAPERVENGPASAGAKPGPVAR